MNNPFKNLSIILENGTYKDVQTGKTEKINYTHIFPNVLLECERLYDTVSKINEQVAKLTGEQQ